MKETETNQLLLEVQSREMSANAVETNSRSTTMFTMIHSDILSGMFNSCTIHSVKINLNRPQDKTQKVNCLNFRKFLQLCISLLEMISILVIGCHPNFEPIQFKLAHVKRKLILIN